MARNEKNEKSDYYNSVTSTPISKEELELLQSTFSNCFFTNLNNNQLVLQNN